MTWQVSLKVLHASPSLFFKERFDIFSLPPDCPQQHKVPTHLLCENLLHENLAQSDVVAVPGWHAHVQQSLHHFEDGGVQLGVTEETDRQQQQEVTIGAASHPLDVFLLFKEVLQPLRQRTVEVFRVAAKKKKSGSSDGGYRERLSIKAISNTRLTISTS